MNIQIASGIDTTYFGFDSLFGFLYYITFYQLDNSQTSNNYTQASTTFRQNIQNTTITNISYSQVGTYTVNIYQYGGSNSNSIPTYNQCNQQGQAFGSFTINVVSSPCFKEGTRILTNTGYKCIQELRKGDLIQTLKNGCLPIECIGVSPFNHTLHKERIKDQLYICSPHQYPELIEDLVITGCHSLLVNCLTQEQGEKTIEDFGCIFETDGKPRLMAYLDEKAKVYEIPGTYKIYHLALQNENYTGNYGIYANGLLVESCSIRYLKELSNLQPIE